MYEHNLDKNVNACVYNYILYIIIHVLIFIDMNKTHCTTTTGQTYKVLIFKENPVGMIC